METLESRGSDSSYSPWTNWYEEMAKKTAIRRLFKMLPVSVEYLTRGDENILRYQDGDVVEVDVYDSEPPAYTSGELNQHIESADVEEEPPAQDPKEVATSLRRSIGQLMGQCNDLSDEDKDKLRAKCAEMTIGDLEEVRAGLEQASTDIKSDGQISERAEVVYMLGQS